MPARVDVMMPAYNAAGTIREAIESILAQTMRDFSLIVVNDGSTDETPAILTALSREDRRIHVVTTPNGGIVNARNEGLRHTAAEYVAVLDSDDIAFPDRLERQLAYMEARPHCVGVGGVVEHMDENGVPLKGLTQPGAPSDSNPAQAPAREPYMVHSTVMMRRAVVMDIGGYRHVPHSEDSDLFWRLQERGDLVNLPDTFAKYRVHTQSASSSVIGGRLMAVGSQIGAISALRRRAGREDLTFDYEMMGAMKKAQTLAGMAAIFTRLLDAREVEHLRIAASAKFMELANYRPFELDMGDCEYIRAALPLARRLTPQNQKELDWYVTVTAARLVRKRMWREAMTLTPPKNYAIAGARLLLKR